MRQRRPVRAILFDLYGTLVEIRDRRWPYRALIRGCVRPVSPRALMRQRLDGEALRQHLGCEDPVAFAAFQQALSRELASVARFPDAEPTLRALRAEGYALALISNLTAPYADAIGRLGLADCFDRVVLSCDVGAVKPEPEIFGCALAALGIGPEEAVMVGDGWISDVRGARSAGLAAVHLCRRGPVRGRRSIQSLHALSDRLRRPL